MDTDLLMIIAVLIVGFYMAWNIGANDVSNAMGTSVGSGALTLKKAILIAAILEFAGAFFLGSNVSRTMQDGLIHVEAFNETPSFFVLGMFSALLATSLWLQIASFFGWPVSTTHAIVGAIIGFGAAAGGIHAVKWQQVGPIALSWVISPALSALFGFLIFSVLQRKILFSMNPVQSSKKLVPIFTGVVLMTFTVNLLTGGVKNLPIHLSLFETILVALGIGLLGYILSFILIKRTPAPAGSFPKETYPQQLYSLNKSLKHLRRAQLSADGPFKEHLSSLLGQLEVISLDLNEKSSLQKAHSEYDYVEKMFAFLQIFSACYVAFAHGANDVANAIGPVAAIFNVIRSHSLQTAAEVPTWLLAFGGLGIVIGLSTWGWRVIQTIGKKITELTPTRGFSAEFGAATTILVATKLGLPISTTHCIVGAVLGVGLAKGLSALNLRTLRDIALSWIITIPCSAILCIIIYYIIKSIFSF